MTLADALTTYRILAKAEGKSPKTVSWVSDATRLFIAFMGQGCRLEDVTADDLRRFILALQAKKAFSGHPLTPAQDRHLSSAAVASYVRAIKALFAHLHREGVMAENALGRVKIPKVPQNSPPTLTEKQLRQLLAQPNRESPGGFRDYAIMLVLFDSVLRISELLNLKLSDVDLEEGTLRIMRKGGKEGHPPVGARAVKALLRYKLRYRPESPGCDRFFVTGAGRPLDRTDIEHRITRYGRKIGLRIHPHMFRHSGSVWYLRNGGDPFTLQKMLGHTTLAMTRRYCELADADVKQAHKRFSPVDRLGL